MCNHHVTPEQAEAERYWNIGRSNPVRWWKDVHPRSPGPFIRMSGGTRELVIGEWGLIPPFARTRELKYSTNNARCETIAERPVFRDAWRRGQRCIIPAASFDEPCWETGHNVWWRFRRADGDPWGLARGPGGALPLPHGGGARRAEGAGPGLPLGLVRPAPQDFRQTPKYAARTVSELRSSSLVPE